MLQISTTPTATRQGQLLAKILIELLYPASWVQLWHTEDSGQHLTYFRFRRRRRPRTSF